MNRRFPLRILTLLATVVAVCFFSSCKKESILTQGGSVRFSADTLMFDTVFTQQGSSTRSVIIYNNEKQKIRLSNVRLKNGTNSPFRLNINGVAGKEVKDIEIAASDSIYVFAAVTIDPNADNQPFVVEDELIATLNGIDFSIPIIAFGQNVHYVVDSVLTTQTWTNDKPYVVINSAAVDENQTLTIDKGVRVYMHANSRLFVLGTLKITGTKDERVTFQGDRIDRDVLVGNTEIGLPGEWGGLYFFSASHDNEINHAIFRNGGLSTLFKDQQTIAALIQLDSDEAPGTNPKLRITNSIINNCSQYGIIAFNSSMYMDNCVVSDCQWENLVLLQGGNYDIRNSTIGSYGTSQYFSKTIGHIEAVVQNYYYTSQTTYDAASLNFNLSNSIIYSNQSDNQVFIDKKEDAAATVALSHSLLRSDATQPSFISVSNCLFNQDPMFVQPDSINYHLQVASPAIGAGTLTGSSTDIDGVPRSTPPSMGAYEYVP